MDASANRLSWRSGLFLLLALVISAGALLLLPPEVASAAMLALLLVGIGAWGVRNRHLFRDVLGILKTILGGIWSIILAFPRLNGQLWRREQIIVSTQNLTIRRAAVEWVLVLAMATAATTVYHRGARDGLMYSGDEAEWLTSSVFAAHLGLREYGRIPRWQPYLEFGEPLVDNAFSFILNPFSGGPSLLLGGEAGILYGVVISAVLAGLGGWFLGWVMGFGTLGRVLLALLLIGKGNMTGMFNTGYYQLAAAQAYFPWIIGALLAIFRFPGKRWPPVLAALSFTLLWFAGNIWYTLPMVISCLVIVLAQWSRPLSVLISWFSAPKTPTSNLNTSLPEVEIRRYQLVPLALAAALTIGLSAVTLLPVGLQYDRIGKHPPETRAGWEVPLHYAVQFYTSTDLEARVRFYVPTSDAVRDFKMNGLEPFYYSFVLPPAFALLLLLFPLYSLRLTRIWLAALLLFILFTLWGMGGQQPFLWLYENVPALAGWRCVGRALAVSAFWLAVLVAMRADALWNILRQADWSRAGLNRLLRRIVPLALLAVLVGGSALAAWQVNRNWLNTGKGGVRRIHQDDRCVTWLRAQNPSEQIAVWKLGYDGITTYLNNRVRTFDVQADFEMVPLDSTAGAVDLTTSLPEYGLPWTDSDRRFMREQLYTPIVESPNLLRTDFPCAYRKANTLPYAFTVPLVTLDTTRPIPHIPGEGEFMTLPLEAVSEVTTFQRQPDNITLLVSGIPNDLTLITVQERAYPGWRVFIDGQPAKLQSVGKQIGVFLPLDDRQHIIYFEYRPPLLYAGGVITILSALFCTLYLLRAERLLRRRNRHK